MDGARRLTEAEGETLLRFAREAVHAAVEHTQVTIPAAAFLATHRGVFVTLKSKGRLRGCIGYPIPAGPLAEILPKAARAAALDDHRFEAVSASELDRLKIEVSVLSPPVFVHTVADIEIGRHGLIVSYDSSRGLLLPQVASEQGWDRETLLEQTCVKAGLARSAWQSGAQLQTFEAQVFEETV